MRAGLISDVFADPCGADDADLAYLSLNAPDRLLPAGCIIDTEDRGEGYHDSLSAIPPFGYPALRWKCTVQGPDGCRTSAADTTWDRARGNAMARALMFRYEYRR